MTGRVILVGGGPGDPDLITVRGLDRLMAAHVVIADRLGPVRLLDRLGPDVEIVNAARSPGRRTLSYDEIVAIMIDRSRAGKTVVRLKGGDPFIFAHGAQEVRSCTDAGIPVEVVPGVTSATAAPVLAGVPLTSTVGAVGFTVVSGHLDPADAANRLDWTAVARSGTSIVILMGMRNLAAIVARLIADGVPPDTPSHCVSEASRPSQRSVDADLSNLSRAVSDAGLTNPAVVVIEAGSRPPTGRVLVLGGSGSGKSEFAERQLAGTADVCYVATGSTPAADAEWLERIERHRTRRPASWSTAETTDLAGQLAGHGGSTFLVDSITTWLARAMDEAGCWDDSAGEQSEGRLRERIDDLVTAWRGSTRAVAVSDEVGSGVVPATVSGRQFRDHLGRLNQRLAAAADEVYLVTAGIGQRLR